MTTDRFRALNHRCPQHDQGLIYHDCTCWQKCCCHLVEITTPEEAARGEVHLVRGRSNGCPVHETEAETAQREAAERAEDEQRIRRTAAEKRARLT